MLAVRPLLTLLFSAVPIALTSQRTAPPTGRDFPSIAITGITVIDMVVGVRVPEQTVVVRGNRIIALGPTASMGMPRGARRVDGHGKYLIPGLWDMHVHTFRNRMDGPGENTDDSEVFFPAFVANGVTGVRDMSTDLADNAQIRRWTNARRAGKLIAPRMIGGSPLLDGKPTIQPNALPVTTVSEARHIVDSLIDGGVGYIKVYSGLQRDVYFAIAAQAKRRGVPFAGHVPLSVKAGEASDAGQRSIEHLTEVIADCSPELRAISERQNQLVRDTTVSRDSLSALRRTYRQVVSERLDCAPLAARFVRNQTWQVPTFTVKRPRAFAHDPATRADPRLKFISPQLMAEWKATGLRSMDAMSPTDVELQRMMFRIEQRIVRQLHAAGVPILAGSDVHNPYVYPGFSLHDELALLVESGLSPLDALRAATMNPARFLGMTDTIGTIAVGKNADLVVLDADPLVDIANTRRIHAVFLDGRFFDRPALDALVAAAERAAAPRPTMSAQATVDLANRYSNVGVIMVWRVDDAGKPVELRGFASGTLIRSRVMVTAGHFTAPATSLGALPPSIRLFASFSPTDAKDPKTWIPVVRQATHPSMPHCPPPPQCDPTDEILVAPLEPGIADVGLVFLAHAPPGIKPARFASPGALEKSEGAQTTIVGYGTTTPRRDVSPNMAIEQMWDGKRRIRTSTLRKVVDETWALWSIPSYVCSGDSGGGIFLNSPSSLVEGRVLAANVSDGGPDCRRHNNNNRLDTRAIQKWMNDTIYRYSGAT